MSCNIGFVSPPVRWRFEVVASIGNRVNSIDSHARYSRDASEDRPLAPVQHFNNLASHRRIYTVDSFERTQICGFILLDSLVEVFQHSTNEVEYGLPSRIKI